MPVPAEFQGVWKRAGLVIDGDLVVDTQGVYWFQTENYYGDIRFPLVGAVPSGDQRRAEFQETWAMWGRDVHISDGYIFWHSPNPGAPEPDGWSYRWQDAVLVESGASDVDGKSFDWEEYWVRLTRPDDVGEHDETDEQVVIKIGGYRFAAAVHGSSGELSTRIEGEWQRRFGVMGDEAKSR
jgi:hypothetical protein